MYLLYFFFSHEFIKPIVCIIILKYSDYVQVNVMNSDMVYSVYSKCSGIPSTIYSSFDLWFSNMETHFFLQPFLSLLGQNFYFQSKLCCSSPKVGPFVVPKFFQNMYFCKNSKTILKFIYVERRAYFSAATCMAWFLLQICHYNEALIFYLKINAKTNLDKMF